MKTNQFFSFNRCLLLLRNDLLINYKKYILTIIAAVIVGTVILNLNMPKYHYDENQFVFGSSKYQMLFVMYLFALGAFVGSSFTNLSNKTRISNYILIPSSVFEKFLSQFLIRVIAGSVLFLAIFWLDAQIARSVAVSQMIDLNTQLHYADGASMIEVFSFKMLAISSNFNNNIIYHSWPRFAGFILIFLALGIYLFSVNLFFRKLALIKTILSLAAVITMGLLLMNGISYLFYPETKGFDNKLFIYIFTKNFSNIEIWMYSVAFLTLLFLLPLGYFKLKEKQV